MEQTRSQLLAEHRKAESECLEYTLYPMSLAKEVAATSTKPSSVNPLVEALALTTGDRQKAYGAPWDDFSRTAGLWTSLLKHKLKEAITPNEVALAMICLKMSREQNKHKQDNLVDMAGYVNCLHMLIEQKQHDSP